MRHLIALFACSLVMATASASDPAPKSAKPAVDAKSATVKAILEGKPTVAGKPMLKPDLKAMAAAADAATAAAKPAAAPAPSAASEDQAEVDLSVRIAERLAELRAQQQVRAAKAASAKRAADARRRKEAEAAIAVAAKPKNGTHWSYEGEYGPANWSNINTAWARCGTGNRQSPIDLRDGMKVDLEQIAFDYHPSSFSEVDNGHTIQVTVGGGNFLTVGNQAYELQQFHFHRPSEERINGKGTEMVIHLVHRSVEGKLLVLAVLLERGKANSLIQTVWNNLPLEKKQSVSPSILLDVNEALPEKREYFTYMGSLTEPPCTEDVLWIVMKQPMQASPTQMALFSRLYPLNARPVQQSNGRMIKESN
ncbi:carbonic anhydrase [Telluria aromaticivorans]|uniref:carbonic anhydrase n=1 Tax=Telluria aromaticivorans TaxID=2725995 RepID=A0A7Y2NZZ5_9BURK|nr:carbonic anhydrase family protein [Telluria aromaticivorans]NNG23021.1 carbonic anhydrase family protein [Telluria aromaticivorans]